MILVKFSAFCACFPLPGNWQKGRGRIWTEGMTDDLKHSFGFQEVDTNERRARIRALFDAIAGRYDLMNDLMSFGIHRLWKRTLARMIAQGGSGGLIIDLAGGTGDVARLVARRPGNGKVVVVDASVEMMKAGRKAHPRCAGALAWVAAEGERLPFGDDAVDVLTIAFGLRNMSDPDAALREALRVLKPGGRFYCLEFSRPQWWLKPFYDLYSFLVIPRLGAMVAGEPSAYRYLIESIRRFPGQKALTDKMRYAGFSDVRWRNLSFGIAAIHHARKAKALPRHLGAEERAAVQDMEGAA